jgi:hypothetical protein
MPRGTRTSQRIRLLATGAPQKQLTTTAKVAAAKPVRERCASTQYEAIAQMSAAIRPGWRNSSSSAKAVDMPANVTSNVGDSVHTAEIVIINHRRRSFEPRVAGQNRIAPTTKTLTACLAKTLSGY